MPEPYRLSDAQLRAIIRDEIGRLIENDVLGAAIRHVVVAVLTDHGIEEIGARARGADRTKAH